LNEQGFLTAKNRMFNKDSVRDMLCNPYFAGKIRYRGMSVRPKGVSYRSTPPQVSEGQHEPIISQELWDRCQALRASRRVVPKPGQKAARVHLLQSLAVCAHCGRRLRVQTPKNYPTYYREDSHLRGYYDCPYSGQSIHADNLDEQVAALIQSLKLTPTWEEDVRKLLQDEQRGPDPENDRKGIRSMLRLMRDNFERELYEGEEYQYWQKVSSLKENRLSCPMDGSPSRQRIALIYT
jgi:Recombinase/Recombinase zinc beta ribbon domain